MNLIAVVEKHPELTKRCVRYYKELVSLNQLSIKYNWRILSGQYTDHPFVSVLDKKISEKLCIGRTSIYNYREKLKSLGLLDVLTKFTVKTVSYDTRNKTYKYSKGYDHRQIIIIPTIRKFLSKTLKNPVAFKKATLIKTYNNIITYANQKLNKSIRNLHTKVKETIAKITPERQAFKHPRAKAIQKLLDKYNVTYKNRDIDKFCNLYEIDAVKFEKVCENCSGIHTYSFNYFYKSFNTYSININKSKNNSHKKSNFFNFDEREHDYQELEQLLVNRF